MYNAITIVKHCNLCLELRNMQRDLGIICFFFLTKGDYLFCSSVFILFFTVIIGTCTNTSRILTSVPGLVYQPTFFFLKRLFTNQLWENGF